MLSTPHILVGGAIVKTIPNPWISLPLAFLSHFLFDYIPHWDFKIAFSPKPLLAAFIDYALGLIFIFLLTVGDSNQLLVILGGFFATAPDFLMATYRVFDWKIINFWPLSVLNKFHMDIQNRISIFWGGLFSIITILGSVFILVR